MKINLKKATLIKRYKRFLADVILEEGTVTTMHVANTGAKTGCATSGDTAWFSTSDNTKRKYSRSWELCHHNQQDWICVNTIRANQLVEEALQAGKISSLKGFSTLRREVKYGSENSKIDFLLQYNDTSSTHVDTYIEVKSVTLLESKQGYFPDAVTTRGQKHLRELIELVAQGKRAVLLFAVLHSGINSVKAAAHIDKKYAQLLNEAREKGVEIIAFKATFSHQINNTNISEFDINLLESVPVEFS